ncbi:MAG: lysophospholipid acyltransferase family protein [Isosphaeraceae bacterium]
MARTEAVARGDPPAADRSLAARLWYRLAQLVAGTGLAAFGGWRVTGQKDFPRHGGVLLVANHASFLDVFLLGISVRRPLNYVARSTLFVPGLGLLMRSIGAFPIQREGMGASGMKETLRRLRRGGIVTLFPEGTRTRDGDLAPLKSGIAVLVSRAGVPVVPAGLAGTFEAWPRHRLLPRPHPLRIHYGKPIPPSEIAGMDHAAVTALIQERIRECLDLARAGLAGDLSP